MKYYFYNLKNKDLNTLKDFKVNEIQISDIDGIHIYYMDSDDDENRLALRKAMNLDKTWVILLSDKQAIVDLSWKTGVDFFIKTEKDNPKLLKLLKYTINKLIERKTNQQGKKLRIRSLDRVDYISPSDIVYIIGDGSYSKIYHENGEILVSKNLKSFEESLSDISYLNRYGKSVILNVKKITALEGRKIHFGKYKSLDFPKYSNGFSDLKKKLLWKNL